MEIQGSVNDQKVDKIMLEKMIRDFITFAEELLNTQRITKQQYHQLVDKKVEFLEKIKETQQ